MDRSRPAPTQHHRAFALSLGWTLALLFLGGVVHATESSLACPDWPTCYGSLVPAMEGGIFWEHLHRLWAGGLLLFWGAGVWLAWREDAPRWIQGAALGGFLLLLMQAVLGGVTVLLRLPTAVSTAHLAAAFVFLGLATVLAVVTGPRWGREGSFGPHAGWVRPAAAAAALLALAQSVLGGAVRHRDAGMACPDVPLCRGEWIPALGDPLVTLHYSHRVAGLLLALLVLGTAAGALRRAGDPRVRLLGWTAIALVVIQVGLGALSVTSALAVVPVSLHTLGGAGLLTALTALAVRAREPGGVQDAGRDPRRKERKGRSGRDPGGVPIGR